MHAPNGAVDGMMAQEERKSFDGVGKARRDAIRCGII
jgi:hypothetical protein